jgi:hypothetical protein
VESIIIIIIIRDNENSQSRAFEVKIMEGCMVVGGGGIGLSFSNRPLSNPQTLINTPSGEAQGHDITRSAGLHGVGGGRVGLSVMAWYWDGHIRGCSNNRGSHWC